MMDSVPLAKRAMRLRESFPVFDVDNVGDRREVFSHDVFLQGSQVDRLQIMRKSSESKEQDEHAFPLDNYFGFALRPHLQGKIVLDLGCFTGGRTAAWYKNYGLLRASGIDVENAYIDAAEDYARLNGLDCDFKLGFGEKIPYPNESFDAILTYDVLEHVVDVDETLRECRRVLVPGGKLFLVFPTYFQPNEHHLGMVSKVPGLQLIFSGKALVRAYYEIIEERGQDAYWYKRGSSELDPHERCHSINGTSFREFMAIVKSQKWTVDFVSRAPVGSVGRSVAQHPFRRLLMKLATPLTYIPFLQEIFLHRITMVITK
jgi:ubiquinone/menaquinone biosynthesis C-methylase UbiE